MLRRSLLRALLLTGIAVSIGAAATTAHAATLTWSGPQLIEHRAPFDISDEINRVSCPTTTLCVAGTGGGNVLTSTNPTGGSGAWTRIHVDPGNSIWGMSCPTASLCVGTDSAGNVLTSTNPTGGAGAWTVTNVDGTTFMGGISCQSATQCVAVDSAGHSVYSTNPTGGASAWHISTIHAGQNIAYVSCPTSNLCVAVEYVNGNAEVSHDGGATWGAPNLIDASHGLRSVGCASSTVCVAVDTAGDVVLASNAFGNTWNAPSNVNGTNAFEGVTCQATTLCVAVDHSGNIAWSNTPFTTWHVVTPNAGNAMWGVSCPSTTLCVAVDFPGNVITATNPTGPASAWTVTSVAQTNSLRSPQCPSAGLCLVADDKNGVLTTTDPLDPTPSWTLANIDPGHFILALSCPTAGFCAAVDEAGNAITSTDPTGGTGAWTTKSGATTSFGGVTCPSASLCVGFGGTGDVVSSTDPTSGTWTTKQIDPGNFINAVSCANTGLCVAVDSNGNALTSTNPGDPTSWSSPHSIDGTNYLSSVSCPSASLCLATDFQGNVVTSTDPASGTWSAPVQIDTQSLSTVTCPTASRCLIADGLGNVLSSTTPTGGAAAWSSTPVDGDYFLLGIACASSGWCLASDSGGNVFTGLGPAPTVVTGSPANVSEHAATMTGTVNPNGVPSSDCHFDYGPTSSYGSSVACPQSIGAADQPVAVSAALSGLGPQQTLHYRIVAGTAAGTSPGADQTLTTLPAPPPKATVVGKLTTFGAQMRLKLACQGEAGQTCAVSVVATSVEKLSANRKRIVGVAAAKRRTRTVVVLTGAAGVAAGTTRSVAVGLNRTGRRLRSRFKKLPAKVTVTSAAKTLRKAAVTFGPDPPKTSVVGASAGRHGTVTVTLRCRGLRSQRCAGAVRVKAAGTGVTIAGLRWRLRAGHRLAILMAPNAAGRGLLAKSSRVPAVVTVSSTYAGVTLGTLTRKVTLRR